MPVGGLLLASLVFVGLVACSDSESPPATVVVEVDSGLEASARVRFPEPGDLGLLAFIRDGNVWVMALPDGAEVQLTADSGYTSPRWSRDGRGLAADRVTSSQRAERWLLDQDGVRLRLWEAPPSPCPPPEDTATCLSSLLETGPDGVDASLLLPMRRTAVSPERDQIALVRSAESNPPQLMVWSVGASETEVVTQASNQDGVWILAGWTSDRGYLLAWELPTRSASLAAGGGPLRLVDLRTGELTGLGHTLLYADFVVPGPSRIALILGGGREAWYGKRLGIAELGSGSRPSVAQPVGVPEGAVTSPAWSSDGSDLAYVVGPDLGPVGGGDRARDGLMLRRIYLHDLATEEVRQLLDDASYRDEHPEWSDDGDHILFARFDETDRISIWLASTGAVPAPSVQVEGLTGDPETTWFGYYGHVDWDEIYDWWQPVR
ncbi:MAG: hypothetical protein WD557_16385 [Dehalococcoidia bacterium]